MRFLWKTRSLFNFHDSFAAPGDYSPEKSTIDNSPKYTFGMKPQMHHGVDTPGKNHFSLINWQKIIEIPMQEPNFSILIAPGDYSPEKSTSVLLDNAPKYTFGMKTQFGKPVDNPGNQFKKIK